MYTILTLTHIPLQSKIQAVVSFEYKGVLEITTMLCLTDDVGSDLSEIYTNETFVDLCNQAIHDRKNIIDNPYIF